MEKALKLYQEEVNKQKQHLINRKEEQKRLAEEIEELKAKVKEGAKKGVLSKVLKQDTEALKQDSEKLSKLGAEKEIIDIEVEALEELAKYPDGEVLAKAIDYVNKVMEHNEATLKEMEQKYEEAKKMKEEAEKVMKDTDTKARYKAESQLVNQAMNDIRETLSLVSDYKEREKIMEHGYLPYLKDALMGNFK